MEHFNKLPLEAQQKLFPNGFRSDGYCHSRERLVKDGTVYDVVIGEGGVLLIKDGKIWIDFDDRPDGFSDLHGWSLKHRSTHVEWFHQYDRSLTTV